MVPTAAMSVAQKLEAIHYHGQLGLQNKGHAIKGFVVSWVLLNLRLPLVTLVVGQ